MQSKEEETKEKTSAGQDVPVEPAESGEAADGAAEKNAEPADTPEKPAEPDWKALCALTLADFDNYKKRAARDREDTYRFAEADILRDVLPAVDNLQLALANARDRADDPFVKGVRLVYDTLLDSLKKHNAEPFDSVGKELDTEKMDAIATLPSADVEEGRVSIESKRGWMLGDRVLRPAQVVVSSGAPASGEEPSAEKEGGKAAD